MTAELLSTFQDRYIPEPNSGCWIWLGAVWKHPYGDRGKVWFPGGVQKFAYRVSYELFVGPIPAGLLICHKCDTPICVNPDHLFAGTGVDNMRDMRRKGRAGKLSARGRLTKSDVSAIRGNTSLTEAQLASQFGVSSKTISRVRLFQTWPA